MRTKYLDKVLRSHLSHCKMHEFSLQKDRHCSCGVEKAREELSVIMLKILELVKRMEVVGKIYDIVDERSEN